MNTPFEDHHKIVTKNEALLTAAQRYATRARNALTKARIELQARLHDTNVSTAWPLAMARRAYDKCKAEFQGSTQAPATLQRHPSQSLQRVRKVHHPKHLHRLGGHPSCLTSIAPRV